ncbi:MAG TPA: hypothetical protein VHA74_01065 [Candidatus Dojkabacteria bacterium]|nr:hypothetical protein [Candidatus Dojkabacteria bacterium]
MIEFLNNFIDNYSLLQIVYALLPYFVGVLVIFFYSKLYLKQTKYLWLILPILVQALVSFKLYLFNYQLHLNLFDYSSLYFVTLPLLLVTVQTIIIFSKITALVKNKREDKQARIKDIHTLHIYIIVFALALEGVIQYSRFNTYTFVLSILPTVLATLTSFVLVKKFIKA